MLNLSKNVIKLLCTHPVVGVWIYLDTSSDLYKACGTHQTAHDFDLLGVPNTYDTFAFYREAMLLLLAFYSW